MVHLSEPSRLLLMVCAPLPFKLAPLVGFGASLCCVILACSSESAGPPQENPSGASDGSNSSNGAAETGETTSEVGDGDETTSGQNTNDKTEDSGAAATEGGSTDVSTDYGDSASEATAGGSANTDTDAGGGGSETTFGEAPQPSSGCQETNLPESGRQNLDVGGSTREFIIDIPDHYEPLHPYPLIFGFHGAKYDAEWVALGEEPLSGPYFGMKAEAQGAAIFVAPEAAPTWSAQDTEFVRAMIESITKNACVDESRLFATGFSMGGIMTARLGCTMADVFRGVAPMSASLPNECDGDFPPLPYLGTHGENDKTISIAQGEHVRDSYVARNGCGSTVGSMNENGCENHNDCQSASPTRWCVFDGQHVPFPHAGVEIWDFFRRL